MKNARLILSAQERDALAARIARLEAATAAEVVCAVATESGRYDRAESLCGLAAGLLALSTLETLLTPAEWGATTLLTLGGRTLTVAGGFALGSLAASHWHGLRRLFTGRRELEAEVARAAHLVFSLRDIGGTENHGGLLIYVSLFERRLEIRADRTIAAKLAPATLQAIRDAVLGHLRAGRLGDGLLAGLAEAEKHLAADFPRATPPANALPNTVLLFHPRP